MIQEEQKKTARLEARVTPDVYALLEHAANLEGRSISEFVVTAAQEAAKHVIERRELIRLTMAEQERFVAAMLNPEPLTPSMERAIDAYHQCVDPS